MTEPRDLEPDASIENFESHTTRYNGNNALCLAVMANLAYEKKCVIEPQIADWGFPNFEFFDVKGTQAFIAGDNEKIIVSFRGTEPKYLEDLLTDVRFALVDGPGGQVHAGFNQSVALVWESLRDHITKFQDNAERPQALWFTGHSLGAALATIAVARLRHDEDKPVYGLYTFGHPRTGDQQFADHVNRDSMTRTYRFVNNNDVVTRVPFRSMRYRHVGKLIYFTKEGDAETDIDFWAKLLDRAHGRFEDVGKLGTDGLGDHDMSNYVGLVRKNVGKVSWD